jgi:hypothetical protein
MDENFFQAGQTYHIEIPNPSNPHLFIIILDQDPITGMILIAPIDSEKYDKGTTVEFEAGEHEFIIRHSYLSYKYARIIHASWLHEQIQKGFAKSRPVITSRKLAEIIEKLPRSQVNDEVLEYFRTRTWKI